MADIDLIPKQYVVRKRVLRQCKWFVATVLAIACTVALARAGIWYGTSYEQREITRLRKNELDSAQIKSRTQEYEQQKAATEKQLKALADVRGRGRAKALLEALDAAYLSGVWFDEVRSHRSGLVPAAPADVSAGATRPPGSASVPTQAPAAVPAVSAAPPRPQQRVELVGHAVDHSRLANLMTRLSAQPTVSDVQLLDTAARVYSTTAVVDFKIAFSIAEKEPL